MGRFLVAPDDSWQRRVVNYTEGNETLLGCFVLAILGWQHGRKPPRLGRVANIDHNGILYSNMQTKDGLIMPNHKLGPVQDVVAQFNRVCDDLKLPDQDRIALFTEFRKWIRKDARARSFN